MAPEIVPTLPDPDSSEWRERVSERARGSLDSNAIWAVRALSVGGTGIALSTLGVGALAALLSSLPVGLLAGLVAPRLWGRIRRDATEVEMLRDRLSIAESELAADNRDELVRLAVDRFGRLLVTGAMDDHPQQRGDNLATRVKTWWIADEASEHCRYLLTVWDLAWWYVVRARTGQYIDTFVHDEVIARRSAFLSACESVTTMSSTVAAEEAERVVRAWILAYAAMLEDSSGLIDLGKADLWCMSLVTLVHRVRTDHATVVRRLNAALVILDERAKEILRPISGGPVLPTKFDDLDPSPCRRELSLPERLPLDYDLHRVEPNTAALARSLEHFRARHEKSLADEGGNGG